MKFECHITVSVSDAELASAIAKDMNWSTSQIARDPILGDDTYFYLTCHSESYLHIHNKMQSTTQWLFKNKIPVIRNKIELIMHDHRYPPKVENDR